MSTHQSPHATMWSVGPRDVTWTDGFWADKWQALCDQGVPSVRSALADQTNAAYFPNFDSAANLREQRIFRGVHWSDGDCYKYLETLAMVYAQTDDQALLDEMNDKIASIARAQESDGYISTNVQLQSLVRWSDSHNHELYNMGHLLTAAVVHCDVTGQREFLEVAIKLADYLYRTFEPRPPELAHFGWNPSNIMGLVDLGRLTGEERYVELAGIFIAMRGSQPGGKDQQQDKIELRRESKATGHAVTGPYLYAGAVDVVAETGDTELLDAVVRVWENATRQRMYITGGIGSHHYSGTGRKQLVTESFGFDYELPNSTAYNETCANIALGMWSLRLARLTGEAQYADVLEQVMYNAGISGVSVDGDRFCYTNPLRWYGADHELLSNDMQGRWHTFTCYCCPVQVTRTIAHLHEWVYGIGQDAVWVHLYGGNKLSTTLPNGSTLALEQTTQYPWNGAVRIDVQDAPATALAVNLRIPAWADGARVAVNGEAVDQPVEPGSYLKIERVWATGDTVELELPMPSLKIDAHPEVEAARNQIAITRGPIVYCLESNDLPDGKRMENVHVPREAAFEPEYQPDLLGGVTVLKTSLVHRTSDRDRNALYAQLAEPVDEQIDASLIPYYAWFNRDLPEMSVWLPLV